MLSTFLGILIPNCPRAVAPLHTFPSGCGDQRAGVALEEAGLTPALAESTLPLQCLDTHKEAAWDMNHLLLGMKRILFSSCWSYCLGGCREKGGWRARSICWDTSRLDPYANKCPKSIHRTNLFTFTASLFSPLCSGSCPHFALLLGGLPAASLYLVS